MADLTGLNVNQPDDKADPKQGAAAERETRTRLVTSFGLEHNLDGTHKIPAGAIVPAASGSASGQKLFIKTSPTLDLYVDNGTTVTNITNNSTYNTISASLTTHKTQATIDHPDGSITGPKIALNSITGNKIVYGEVKQGHLWAAASVPTADISSLVSGVNADALHTHSYASHPNRVIYDTPGTYTWTSPVGVTIIWLTMVAGGGGYNGITTHGGGAGQGVIAKQFTITASTAYTIIIGAAGVANGKGGNSSFGSLLVLTGGFAGISGLAAKGQTSVLGGNDMGYGYGGNTASGGGGYCMIEY